MKQRILELSKDNGLSHIGSCLSMAEVLEMIYKVKGSKDLVILDAGHSHLAHLVAREKFEGKEIKPIHDIHCNLKDGCIPTGSLGIGICIALGIALTGRTVYCVLSDGGCEEGSVWEALRIKTKLQIDNLKVYVNANGWNALGKVDVELLKKRLKSFDPQIKVISTNSDFNNVKGVDAHYQHA